MQIKEKPKKNLKPNPIARKVFRASENWALKSQKNLQTWIANIETQTIEIIIIKSPIFSISSHQYQCPHWVNLVPSWEGEVHPRQGT